MAFSYGLIGTTSWVNFDEALAQWLITNAGWTRAEAGYPAVVSPDTNWILHFVSISTTVKAVRYGKVWDGVTHAITAYAQTTFLLNSAASGTLTAYISALDSDYVQIAIEGVSAPGTAYNHFVYCMKQNGYLSVAATSVTSTSTGYSGNPFTTISIWRESDDTKIPGVWVMSFQPHYMSVSTIINRPRQNSIVTTPASRTLLFPIYLSPNDGVELFALADVYSGGIDLVDEDTIQYDGKTFTVRCYSLTTENCVRLLGQCTLQRTA